jgi:hypothetical protein
MFLEENSVPINFQIAICWVLQHGRCILTGRHLQKERKEEGLPGGRLHPGLTILYSSCR